MTTISRRQFTKAGVAVTAGAALTRGAARAADERPVRIGFVGVGGRGMAMMRETLGIPSVQVPAVCDVNPAAAARAQSIVEDAGQARPEVYTNGETDYERLMGRDDLDAVFLATPWEWHTRMAVRAMEQGKYVAVEVPCAITLDECWQLVDTSEKTGVPCMMMENWSFRRDNLAVLNMIRRGLFGRIVHGHCAHSHNCVSWYVQKEWTHKHLLARSADQYPTHSLGPVLSWMDINCGDRFDTVVSMASGEWGLTDQLARKYGKDSPLAKTAWKQGDIVTTMVRTVQGKTIVINMDMQLPRPYDNRWMIQGTRGLYNEQRGAVYLAGDGSKINPEQWSAFGPYREKYEHRWWRERADKDAKFSLEGHGGVDRLELELFVDAVRHKKPTPIDVYDSVTMSSIFALSEASIAAGSQPVACPDFTRGRWEHRKPYFAIDAEVRG